MDNLIHVAWSPPSHEGEYVIHFVDPDERMSLGSQRDFRYVLLKDALIPLLRNFDVQDRGTRVELVGDRDDVAVRGAFFYAGYVVVAFQYYHETS